MKAASRSARERAHFSQAVRISNGIVYFAPIANNSRRFILRRGLPQPLPRSMHTGNSIIIQAPKMTIFETAANLELWPKILPHYRYIRYLERGHDRNLVVMAAVRSGIPISWTSEQVIDREKIGNSFSSPESVDERNACGLVVQGNASRRPGRDHARPSLSGIPRSLRLRNRSSAIFSSILSQARRYAA